MFEFILWLPNVLIHYPSLHDCTKWSFTLQFVGLLQSPYLAVQLLCDLLFFISSVPTPRRCKTRENPHTYRLDKKKSFNLSTESSEFCQNLALSSSWAENSTALPWSLLPFNTLFFLLEAALGWGAWAPLYIETQQIIHSTPESAVTSWGTI